jgi:predicted phosphate transport protein (TIGR00153 family)
LGLTEWIIPREHIYFDLLEKQAAVVLEAARQLRGLVEDSRDFAATRKSIKDLEHASDDVVHRLYERLNKSFITPIDHEDLARLTSRLDDVLDYIYAAVNRLVLYGVRDVPGEARQFAEIIEKCVQDVHRGIMGLRRLDHDEINGASIEVNRLENEADELLNQAVASLFEGRDAIEIIKMKEIYEFLEAVTDRCEDVTDVLRDILIKYT